MFDDHTVDSEHTEEICCISEMYDDHNVYDDLVTDIARHEDVGSKIKLEKKFTKMNEHNIVKKNDHTVMTKMQIEHPDRYDVVVTEMYEHTVYDENEHTAEIRPVSPCGMDVKPGDEFVWNATKSMRNTLYMTR